MVKITGNMFKMKFLAKHYSLSANACIRIQPEGAF